MAPGLLHDRSIPETTFASAPHKRGQADCSQDLQLPFGPDHLLEQLVPVHVDKLAHTV